MKSSAYITEQRLDFYRARTLRHISLVQKYCKQIAVAFKDFEDLEHISMIHDQSKFEYLERDPYVLITWDYRCKDLGETLKLPYVVREEMSQATEHHVKNNEHHPEFWSPVEVDFINREDRDKPPKQIVNATAMPPLAVAELCADWLAMSEEKGTSPIEWANKNIGKRWQFTSEQQSFIFGILDGLWRSK